MSDDEPTIAECRECKGTGRRPDGPCSDCGGTGTRRLEREAETPSVLDRAKAVAAADTRSIARAFVETLDHMNTRAEALGIAETPSEAEALARTKVLRLMNDKWASPEEERNALSTYRAAVLREAEAETVDLVERLREHARKWEWDPVLGDADAWLAARRTT